MLTKHKKSLKLIREYNLTVEDIARMFSYSSVHSLKNSTAYSQTLEFVALLINHIREEIKNKI